MQKTAAELEQEHSSSIPDWKEAHKRVKSITVDSKLYGKVPYIIAKPTANIMDAVAKYEHDGKVNKIEEVLINSCVKAGNKEYFKEDLDIKNAVLGKVFDLFDRLQVEEKEL